MEVIRVKSVRQKVSTVKNLMRSVGNRLGSVWFYKKSDGVLRRMVYRLHVTKPQYAPEPTGKKFRKEKASNMIVMDVNKITYNHKGNMNGRGAWRTVPLSEVTRLKVNGTIYKFA